MKRIFLLGISCCLLVSVSFGQGQWDLERCVNYAFENNISVKQGKLSVKNAQLSLEQTEKSRYPNLSAGVGQGFNFGRSIDPTTNAFVAQSLNSVGFNINTSVLLYNGGRIKNTMIQNEYDIKASEADIEQVKYDLALQVATAYLTILLNEEQLANAKVSLKQVQDQLAQTNKLISAGSLPANDRLNIEAQIATNEQLVVAAENAVELAELNLKILLQLPGDVPFKIERPTISIPENDDAVFALNARTIFQQSLQVVPNIKAGELKKMSAEKGIEIAKSGKLPTISFSGSIGSNYSSIGRDQQNPNIIPRTDTLSGVASIGGQPAVPVDFAVPGLSITFPNAGFFNQVGSNLNQSVGINISIPIYDRDVTKINMQRAELNVENIDLNNQQIRQNIKADIERAIADAKAAAKQYRAAQRSVTALEAAFANMEQRLKLGAANTFEYSTAKNNLDNAKGNLILTKFDYFFKLKVLDIYQGKPLKID